MLEPQQIGCHGSSGGVSSGRQSIHTQTNSELCNATGHTVRARFECVQRRAC